MGLFKCTHEPDWQLVGESKVIRRSGTIDTFYQPYREKVTTHVCRKCDSYFVVRLFVNEEIAEIGPIQKPSPERPE